MEGFAPLYGVYLPAWTFDLSGEVPYTYLIRQGDRWERRRGTHILLENDLPVAAPHHLPKTLGDEVHRFDLSEMQPYRAELLAGWPAEAYEIPATDAAMAARWYVLDGLRRRVEREVTGTIRDLHFHSSDILISAYRLILLPIWITSYRLKGKRYRAVVNGQSGAISAESPPPGWWASLQGHFNFSSKVMDAMRSTSVSIDLSPEFIEHHAANFPGGYELQLKAHTRRPVCST